jgi:hypothetical protein
LVQFERFGTFCVFERHHHDLGRGYPPANQLLYQRLRDLLMSRRTLVRYHHDLRTMGRHGTQQRNKAQSSQVKEYFQHSDAAFLLLDPQGQ